MTSHPDIEALQTFVIENPELQELESRIAEFNIFEAIGVVRQEARHSEFLSFLLNPAGNHGLGDSFLRRFMTEVTKSTPDPPLNPIEFDLMSMDEAIVSKEWNNIDILIQDPQKKLTCLIENKVFATEHSDQLSRYLKIVKTHFPEDTLIPVFLTPEGDPPSNDEYIPISYDQISELVEALSKTVGSINPNVGNLMKHYVTMLRRHIVTDSEIAELCRRIYRRHQRAVDLILEHRPDLQQQIHDYLVEQIESNDHLAHEKASKGYIRCLPKSWDQLDQLSQGKGWTKSGRILMFEFRNYDRLDLFLVLGPGPAEIRKKIYETTENDPKILRGRSSKLYDKWTSLWKIPILSKNDCSEGTIEELKTKLDKKWDDFLEDELPKFEQAILNANL